MVFNNLFFLFAFLPLAWVAYSLIRNEKAKNIFLLAASLLFYAFGSLTDLCVLLILGAWTFVSGLQLDTEDEKGRQRTFWISAGFLVLVLCFYKYIPYWFSALKLRFPIGISFYTFSAVSYLADVYRRKVPVQKNITAFGLYLAFFGKVNMGPISEYHQLEDQLVSRTVSLKKSGSGALMFVRGLVKKVVFADQIALAYALLANDSSVLGAWLLGLAYTFQLYFDFSGYSDMAIGLGEMFGFHFPENFAHPYESKSITEFWRRWHMTLGTWFREYLYIPLGGNRRGMVRQLLNLFIVWFLTGLWHGAGWNFILWGLYYFVLLALEKFALRRVLERLPRIFQHFYTLFFVALGWVIFACDDLHTLGNYLKAMFGIGVSAGNALALYEWDVQAPFLVILLIASTSFPARIAKQLAREEQRSPLLMVYTGMLLVLSLAFLVNGGYNPFLYFRF